MNLDLFHNPHRFGDMRSWRNEIVELHERGPFHRIEAEGFQPFWAVIGHPEIIEIERAPRTFTNGPLAILASDLAIELRQQQGGEIRTLIHMDAPDHNEYRKLGNDWFRPASIRKLQGRLDELSVKAVDTLRRAGGHMDFLSEVAVPYPLHVILSILGLPEEDYPRMLQLTQQLFGAADPDLQREGLTGEETGAIIQDFYRYFKELTLERRSRPTSDLASAIANGLVHGAPIPEFETLGYYVIVATAGHDTTASAMAEGIARLAQNPEQLRELQARPELIAGAVDEMIRLASPVRHFMRTATEDAQIDGQAFKAGDWLLLSFTAANLDPRLFPAPLEFDIHRKSARPHLAFGSGVHYCLGAQLAKMELTSLFTHILPELTALELDGEPATVKATFVSGLKRLPIRYSLRD